jgi:hypothetical protein
MEGLGYLAGSVDAQWCSWQLGKPSARTANIFIIPNIQFAQKSCLRARRAVADDDKR